MVGRRGESRDGQAVFGLGSECVGWRRGSVSGGLWGLDRCGCLGWRVDQGEWGRAGPRGLD